VWGGDSDCQHVWGDEMPRVGNENRNGLGSNSEFAGRADKAKINKAANSTGSGQFCQSCGAWLGELGAEPTPQMYVEHIVIVMREVKRVLRDDGVAFLNAADSYANPGHYKGNPGSGRASVAKSETMNYSKAWVGAKPKDMCLIPERLKIALQDDGWWIRNTVVWQKTNCMPSSAGDRFTNTWESIIFLAKSQRYYFDWFAVKESSTERKLGRKKRKMPEERDRPKDHLGSSVPYEPDGTGRRRRDVWTFSTGKHSGRFCLSCRDYFPKGFRGMERHTDEQGKEHPICPTCGRWDTWMAHYAVFPPDLPAIAIRAGTSEHGACVKCGSPWERIAQKTGVKNSRKPAHVPGNSPTKTSSTGWRHAVPGTDEWKPTCKCGCGAVAPSIVLDPFGGSGTTGVVSAQLGRSSILIELNPDYAEMGKCRIEHEVSGCKVLFPKGAKR